MTIYLCHRFSGTKLKEIGAQFGVKESAVSQSGRRFASGLEKDKKLQELVTDLGKQDNFVQCLALTPCVSSRSALFPLPLGFFSRFVPSKIAPEFVTCQKGRIFLFKTGNGNEFILHFIKKGGNGSLNKVPD